MTRSKAEIRVSAPGETFATHARVSLLWGRLRPRAISIPSRFGNDPLTNGPPRFIFGTPLENDGVDSSETGVDGQPGG
jgi:hypothetical protein